MRRTLMMINLELYPKNVSRSRQCKIIAGQEIYTFYFTVTSIQRRLKIIRIDYLLQEYCRKEFPLSDFLMGSGPRTGSNVYDEGCSCGTCFPHDCVGRSFSCQLGDILYGGASEKETCSMCHSLLLRFIVHNMLVAADQPYNSKEARLRKLLK